MNNIYQLKITLRGSKPPIWRRLRVAGDITLHRLHRVFQVAMGWEDYHLHMFTIHGKQYSAPLPGDPGHLLELRAKSSQRVKLNTLLTEEGEKFLYEYDFGDGWEHEVLLEKILPADAEPILPVCIKGKRACPPEDVGGIWGYAGFLEAIQNPDHPDHAMYTEWIDGDFDPEALDLDEINQQLQQIR
jgi:hypothetical protein